MNKTKIEWVKNPNGTQGFTSNPIKGYCPVACSYCYSRRDYDRFGWDKTIRWDDAEMHRLMNRKKPAGIFIGSMHEIFLDKYIECGWTTQIVCFADYSPQHRIYLLTKQPQNLIKFSPFPDNCWVGVTVTSNAAMTMAYYGLNQIKAGKKYISFEPLLGSIGLNDHVPMKQWVDWVIIGSQTKPYKPPKIEWVQEIVQACDKASVPVFLKNNLEEMCFGLTPKQLDDYSFWERYDHVDDFILGVDLRQEMPDKSPLNNP